RSELHHPAVRPSIKRGEYTVLPSERLRLRCISSRHKGAFRLWNGSSPAYLGDLPNACLHASLYFHGLLLSMSVPIAR
ncbi:MAG TPA: hypothetical protein VHH94_02985, partial [Gammaproteobacteria bacterium]|nr:hypothetical protein [Gammaproteobacteria bacterium]